MDDEIINVLKYKKMKFIKYEKSKYRINLDHVSKFYGYNFNPYEGSGYKYLIKFLFVNGDHADDWEFTSEEERDKCLEKIENISDITNLSEIII